MPRSCHISVLLLATFLATPLAASSRLDSSSPGLALEGGRWWTREGFVESKVRWVVDGRFVAERPARVAQRIDLGERFVVPPYGDSHAHVLESREGAEAASEALLAAGIFYVRNPNNCRSGRDEVAELVARPETVDVAYSNGGLTGPGAHPIPVYESHALGIGPYWLATPEQVEQMRASRLRAGDCYHAVGTAADLETAWPALLEGRPDFVKIYLDYSERHPELAGEDEAADAADAAEAAEAAESGESAEAAKPSGPEGEAFR